MWSVKFLMDVVEGAFLRHGTAASPFPEHKIRVVNAFRLVDVRPNIHSCHAGAICAEADMLHLWLYGRG